MQEHVLIVDDESAIRQIVRTMLERLGYSCDPASDAAEAREMLAQGRYDVIVTDYDMPGTNGADLITFIRKNAPTSAIVLMSGRLDQRTLTGVGADAYLQKPFTLGDLAQALKTVRSAKGARATGDPPWQS